MLWNLEYGEIRTVINRLPRDQNRAEHANVVIEECRVGRPRERYVSCLSIISLSWLSKSHSRVLVSIGA